MKSRRSNDRLFSAWNAAYWLMRSEARRQVKARYPDCNWRAVEADEACITAVVAAQAEVCLKAMRPERRVAPVYL